MAGRFNGSSVDLLELLIEVADRTLRLHGPEEDLPNLNLHFRGVAFVPTPTVSTGLSVVAPTDVANRGKWERCCRHTGVPLTWLSPPRSLEGVSRC